jgi:hypothetical protein
MRLLRLGYNHLGLIDIKSPRLHSGDGDFPELSLGISLLPFAFPLGRRGQLATPYL